ncbi:MAG: methionyl-tRNA formyltransferase [Desulfobacterales bacterium]
MKKHLTIIFMGTPEFAVPSLLALHAGGHDVSLVVTQPDRPKGRGKKMAEPPVKRAADSLGYPVVQPKSLKDPHIAHHLKSLKPDVFVVVAYGHILSRDILDIPTFGAINLHASILPKYRGPAPIQWAIINREKVTGVTAMFMDAGMDTGDILSIEKVPIRPDDTAATLHDTLAQKGADLLIETLARIQEDSIQRHPQDHNQATYAPLLKKEDGRIDWHESAVHIDAFVRGMSPWPGAFTFYEGQRLKIFSVQPVQRDFTAPPGTIIKSFPGELAVATGQGALLIRQLQGASGKRLDIKDFLRGHPMPPGARLE